MGATRDIAAFIAAADIAAFPGEAIHLAKRSIMDCLGVTLAGSLESAGKIIRDCVQELGGKPLATVINGGFKTSPPLAALANGTMAHALDYDDASAVGGGHATVSILPAIFALGENPPSPPFAKGGNLPPRPPLPPFAKGGNLPPRPPLPPFAKGGAKGGVSGLQVLEAYLVGFEVGARISAAIEPGHSDKGWHPTATVNALRATAAGAKILRLSVDQTEIAFGLAASMSGGLRLNIGTMTKPFHAGNAARNGIIACMLASRGFTAEAGVLEHSPYGFCEIFSGGEKPDLEKLTEGLGTQFQIVSPGIGIKKFPCVAGIHSAIDAVLYLVDRYAVAPEMVEAIECGVSKMRPQTLRSTDPKTPLEGKFNLAYGLSRAILDHELGLGQFTQAKIDDPKVKALMKKTKIDLDPVLVNEKAGKDASVVTLRLKDGQILTQRVDKARGTAKLPLSDKEVEAKYRQCAGLVLSKEGMERSIAILNDFEHLSDINELTDILVMNS